MEKLIYALWRDESVSREDFNRTLLGPVAQAIEPHVRALRVNVQDATVSGGNSPSFAMTNPQMEAIVQLWVDTAYPPRRKAIEEALRSVAKRAEGWLVSESTPLPNAKHPPARKGERTEGFSQIVFLPLPKGREREEWRASWQNFQTELACETQSTFEYVQNYVVRPLDDASPYVAIVEECFPHAALTDFEIYYDGPGDPEKAKANNAAMMQNVTRFMGEEGCDCFPTSQFDIKPIG